MIDQFASKLVSHWFLRYYRLNFSARFFFRLDNGVEQQASEGVLFCPTGGRYIDSDPEGMSSDEEFFVDEELLREAESSDEST